MLVETRAPRHTHLVCSLVLDADQINQVARERGRHHLDQGLKRRVHFEQVDDPQALECVVVDTLCTRQASQGAQRIKNDAFC